MKIACLLGQVSLQWLREYHRSALVWDRLQGGLEENMFEPQWILHLEIYKAQLNNTNEDSIVIGWVVPPPSNCGKWRFIGIPLLKTWNHPGGDWHPGRVDNPSYRSMTKKWWYLAGEKEDLEAETQKTLKSNSQRWCFRMFSIHFSELVGWKNIKRKTQRFWQSTCWVFCWS